MKLDEARAKFIASWGALGSHWGINRSMAQVHALMMISPDPLSQDDIMESLDMSRGNANMNIRALIDWGLVQRVVVAGQRKEYYSAEKDTWKIARLIIKERKKRELDPMLKLLDELKEVEGDRKDKTVKQFLETVNGIKHFGQQADRMLDAVVKADEHWFTGSLMKLFK